MHRICLFSWIFCQEIGLIYISCIFGPHKEPAHPGLPKVRLTLCRSMVSLMQQ